MTSKFFFPPFFGFPLNLVWSLPQFFTLCECVITKSSWKMWLITFWYNQTNILRPSYHCILIFPFSLLLNWKHVCSNVASNVKSRHAWSLWNIYGLDVCLGSPEPQLMSCLKICKAREPTFAGSMRFGCFSIISLTIRQPQLCPWCCSLYYWPWCKSKMAVTVRNLIILKVY